MRKRKRIMVITVAILAVLLILIIGAGFFFASSSMGIRRQTLDEARKWQEEHYDLSWYDPLEKTDYQVASYDGYTLTGTSEVTVWVDDYGNPSQSEVVFE